MPGYGIPVSEPVVRSWLSDRSHIHWWQFTYSQERFELRTVLQGSDPRSLSAPSAIPTYSTPWRAAACSLDESLSGRILDLGLTKKTDKEEELQ